MCSRLHAIYVLKHGFHLFTNYGKLFVLRFSMLCLIPGVNFLESFSNICSVIFDDGKVGGKNQLFFLFLLW